jgi:hypothetical protein
MKETAAVLELYRQPGADKLPLLAEPVLRYSNAERDIGSLDGAMFVWIEDTRPMAAVSFSVRRLNNSLYYECASFSSSQLECRRNDLPIWSPQRGGLMHQRLSEAPPVAGTKPQRLTQMRNLARRFTAKCYSSRTDEPTELRLLPQPLHRFSVETSGILDGAMFAFVVSNDPELLLLLEAASAEAAGAPEWRFSLARMSSLKETVSFDSQEIWSVPNYYRDPAEDRKTGPYVEARVGPVPPDGAQPGDSQ